MLARKGGPRGLAPQAEGLGEPSAPPGSSGVWRGARPPIPYLAKLKIEVLLKFILSQVVGHVPHSHFMQKFFALDLN